jgi:hypothetical protein
VVPVGAEDLHQIVKLNLFAGCCRPLHDEGHRHEKRGTAGRLDRAAVGGRMACCDEPADELATVVQSEANLLIRTVVRN